MIKTTIKVLCILILLSGLLSDLRAQTPIQDTFAIPKKRFWRASGELFLSQLVPWSYNYFVRNADFAKISFKSIGRNLNFSNWEWDDNHFKTNQFAHPYHGNLYFNSFRTNGYSFWQAAPAAFAGSYMWEVAGETHPAAPNDFVNTSLGGIALGEMTYRLSNAIVNTRARGFSRQMQEVLALLVNPVNGLNRILDGNWGRVYYNRDDSVKPRIVVTLDLGSRRFSEREEDVLDKGHNELYMRLRLQYGDPYAYSKKPFQHFTVQVEAGASDSAYLNAAQVNGNLVQWPFHEGEHSIVAGAITMNYDYFHNSAFEYGGQSFTFRLNGVLKRNKPTAYTGYLAAGIIALAAVPDKYLYYGEGRDYDYGPGIAINAGGNIVVKNKLTCTLGYRGGWFRTINGNSSSYFLNAASAEARYFIGRKISIGMELGHFSVKGYYRDYDDVYRRYPFIRYSIGAVL